MITLHNQELFVALCRDSFICMDIKCRGYKGALVTQCILIKRWEYTNPPESAVPLTDADTTQHSLLVRPVLAQELTHDVSTQAEAHHDQLGLWIRPLNVANHGCKLPCATWMDNSYCYQSIHNTYSGWSISLLLSSSSWRCLQLRVLNLCLY